MSSRDAFDDLPPTAGELPADDAAAFLEGLGEDELLADIREKISQGASGDEALGTFLGPSRTPLWASTNHQFGFVPVGATSQTAILPAATIDADLSLQRSRVRITLERIRAADYPGRGIHNILVDFSAVHQADGAAEQLHFAHTYRVQDGQHAGVVGYPIFVGLAVGTTGLAFRALTVNVQNDNDQDVLKLLEADAFTQGLKLLHQVNPVLQPFTTLAGGVVRLIASRHANVPVQSFYLGLDFAGASTGARLAQGSYIAAQVPQSDLDGWDWRSWEYDPLSGTIRPAGRNSVGFNYNYLIFGVTHYEDSQS